MNLKSPVIRLAGAFCLVLAVLTGCDQGPSAPARAVGINVTLTNLNNIRASLLGAAQNEILYHLDGPGDPPGHGVFGPFSTLASSGSVSFILKAPSNPGGHVLSLQLNDAATHQPLAVGAAQFNFASGLSGGLVVDMGSVTRNCYFTDEGRTPGFASNPYNSGSAYNFAADTLIAGTTLGAGYDIAFDCPLGPYLMEDATTAVPTNQSIAYLGNGEMVDFDRVPPAADFFPLSTQAKAAMGATVTTLQAGDVYCLIPKSFSTHIWIQITDPGVMLSTGPSFRFRVNSTLSYFGYEQTPADLGSNCASGW